MNRDRKRSLRTLAAHHHGFFDGHAIAVERWPVGPAASRVPDLYIHAIGPGPRINAWTYATVGMWNAVHSDAGHGLEFLITGPERDPRLIEILTMVAYYHAGPSSHRLGLGHTVPIGEPWLPGSEASHLLVSLPYPYGPDLEVCVWKTGHARLLWLVPITEAERNFKVEHGLEALEERLEGAKADVINPARQSVI